MRRALAAMALALLVPAGLAAAEDPEARGDRLWVRRAEGFAAARRVDPALANETVAAYEEALRARPDDLAIRFKLAEALYFAGHFGDTDPGKARARFERAVEVSEDACARVAAKAGGAALDPKADAEARARALAAVPEAVDAHFWAAISWGLWGMSHSVFASAMQDVAGKIRDHATLVAALDPAYRDAAGWRILGRLHAQVPHIPLVTDWVSRDEGIALLRKATAVSARDPRNPLFLAEALLADRPEEKDQALALLRGLAARTPDPACLVEETEILDQARKTLGNTEPAR
ncbi:MAG TPA: hypothetical protein VLQ45_06935 [Thermoanaerobaculia bacterium]|nr:hypothetical protein [Thermoanaerobaculia bacterium]